MVTPGLLAVGAALAPRLLLLVLRRHLPRPAVHRPGRLHAVVEVPALHQVAGDDGPAVVRLVRPAPAPAVVGVVAGSRAVLTRGVPRLAGHGVHHRPATHLGTVR